MNSFRLLLSPHLIRLGRDQRGVSAVEFAMLLPLMITLYLGVVEISQAVGIDRKVTLTTRTVADLASQVQSITNTDMTNLLGASAAVIAPYDAAPLKVTVSEVYIDANGTALLNHHFIKLGFLDAWKKVVPGRETEMFLRLQRRLDDVAAQNGELGLTIPMAYIEAVAA